jgi:hypothetical protein
MMGSAACKCFKANSVFLDGNMVLGATWIRREARELYLPITEAFGAVLKLTCLVKSASKASRSRDWLSTSHASIASWISRTSIVYAATRRFFLHTIGSAMALKRRRSEGEVSNKV